MLVTFGTLHLSRVEPASDGSYTGSMHVHAKGGETGRTSKVLKISLVVTAVYILLLVVAGVRAHSLALLSEAGHNLSDFFALLLSWGAVFLQARAPDERKTFGYNRAGVLAAFVNGLSLVLISFYIWYEAFHRLLHPVEVHAGWMIWVAAAGVVMNGAIALILMRRASRHQPAQRLDSRDRRYVIHRGGDSRRRCDCAHPSGVDRSGAINWHRCDDPVVLDRHHPREPQHSAGGNSAGHGTGSHRRVHLHHPRGEQRARPARVEHRQRHAFALVSRGHRRYARIGERSDSAHYTRRVRGPLSHPPYDDSV